MVVQLRVAVVDELRQDVGGGLVRRTQLLLLLQPLPQVLGLDLELLGHLLAHGRGHAVLEDLGGPAPPLGTNLQEVCRDALLRYRLRSGGGAGPPDPPQLSSIEVLT